MPGIISSRRHSSVNGPELGGCTNRTRSRGERACPATPSKSVSRMQSVSPSFSRSASPSWVDLEPDMSAQRREDDLAVEPAEQTVENAAHSSASTDERPPQPGATRVGEHHRLGLAHRIGNQSLSVKTPSRRTSMCARPSSVHARRFPDRGAPAWLHRSCRRSVPDSSRAGCSLSSGTSRGARSKLPLLLPGRSPGGGPDRMLRRAAPGFPATTTATSRHSVDPSAESRPGTREEGLPGVAAEDGVRAVRVSVRVSNGLLADRRIAFLPVNIGAGERTRTADLLITNQLLYQLSYAGFLGRRNGLGRSMPAAL